MIQPYTVVELFFVIVEKFNWQKSNFKHIPKCNQKCNWRLLSSDFKQDLFDCNLLQKWVYTLLAAGVNVHSLNPTMQYHLSVSLLYDI